MIEGMSRECKTIPHPPLPYTDIQPYKPQHTNSHECRDYIQLQSTKFTVSHSRFCISRLTPLPHKNLPYFRVIGTIRPRPKARLLTFNTTPICHRLCSLARIIAFDSSASTIASACGETAS